MKKLILAAVILAGTTLKAQHDISTDVLGFAFSKYGIGYEYALNSNSSVGINFNYSTKNLFDDGTDSFGNEVDYTEMNIIPEYKYFMTPNKGNDGVYIGVYGKYRTSTSKDVDYLGTIIDITDPLNSSIVSGTTDVTSSGLSLGAMLGYKWKSKGALFLEVTGGVGKFLMSDVKTSDSVVDDLTLSSYDEDDYIPYIGNTMAVDLRIAVKVGLRFGGGSSSE